MRQWRQCPPIHRLVASYLGYRAEEPDLPPEPEVVPADGTERFFVPGTRNVPPSQALIAAQSPGERIQALEQMFFGEVKHVEQL